METFKEILEAIKNEAKGQITSDSTQEQIEKVDNHMKSLEKLEASHNELVTENAKLKDTIVRMVQTQGNDKAPGDDSSGRKPLSIDEAMSQVAKETKKEG